MQDAAKKDPTRSCSQFHFTPILITLTIAAFTSCTGEDPDDMLGADIEDTTVEQALFGQACEDIRTDLLWSQSDANETCPRACSDNVLAWNGQWTNDRRAAWNGGRCGCCLPAELSAAEWSSRANAHQELAELDETKGLEKYVLSDFRSEAYFNSKSSTENVMAAAAVLGALSELLPDSNPTHIQAHINYARALRATPTGTPPATPRRILNENGWTANGKAGGEWYVQEGTGTNLPRGTESAGMVVYDIFRAPVTIPETWRLGRRSATYEVWYDPNSRAQNAHINVLITRNGGPTDSSHATIIGNDGRPMRTCVGSDVCQIRAEQWRSTLKTLKVSGFGKRKRTLWDYAGLLLLGPFWDMLRGQTPTHAFRPPP